MPKKPIDHSNGLPDGSRSQRGATVVEFAFIAGLVFLIIFGIIEFGLIFLQEHYVANAAREAARIGVRANNYSTYDSNAKKNSCFNKMLASSACTDRKWRTKRVAVDYLNAIYDDDKYEDGEVAVDVDHDNYSLIVTVTINNSNIKKSGLIRFSKNISFTTSMEYEDKTEYTREHL